MLLALDELWRLGGEEVRRNLEWRDGVPPPLRRDFEPPVRDLSEIQEQLGIILFTRERTLAQYVVWAIKAGLFACLEQSGRASVKQVVEDTPLTEVGADSLLGVLCALGLVTRTIEGDYLLPPIAKDYFTAESPYFVGDQIEARGYAIPPSYLKSKSRWFANLRLLLLGSLPSIRYGSIKRLHNQHARNLGAAAVAVRTGEFEDVNLMVDIAGGSGAFSIPLAFDVPKIDIILTDLPKALKGTARILATHGLEERVKLVAHDALSFPWRLPACDGMYLGNFLHAFSDDTCLDILSEAKRHIAPGGQLWIHEMVWRNGYDGPLITALYHAAMRGAGPGRQRSVDELSNLLTRVGFTGIYTRSTAGAFALVSGKRGR